MPVTLRKRRISGNRYSLYADAGTSPGGKRFKSLKLYIDAKPGDKLSRDHNKELLVTAGQICRRKENELAKPEIYSHSELEALKRAEKSNCSFVTFCKEQILKIQGDSYRVYETALKHFLISIGMEDVKCGSITLLMVDEFRDYLPAAKNLRRKGIMSQNSAATYFAAFKGLLDDAYKGGFFLEDINSKVDVLAGADSNRQFPDEPELITLFQTECIYPGLKEMAMFSALTGLRFSDCSKLDRSEIKQNEEGYYLDFSQKKTNDEAILPINNLAASMIPPLGGKPFSAVDYNNMQRPLKKWIQDAGITKHLTFHSFRHCYATLLLLKGVDIFTVSKMLGHKSLQSTTVYTHILDSRKVEAANKISINLQLRG